MAYIDKKKKVVKKNSEKNKSIVKLPISTVSNLIYYALTIDDLVTENNLLNLKRFLDLIDIENSYDEEKELPTIQMIRLLYKILEGNLDYTTNDYEELKTFVKDGTTEDKIPRAIIEMVFNHVEECGTFDEKNIRFWNKFIENRLNQIAVNDYVPTLKRIIEMCEHPDPEKDEKYIIDAKESLIELNKIFNINTMNIEHNTDSFNIADRKTAKLIIKQSLESIYNPGNRISTGYKMLDEMLGGGMQGGRCYMLLGVAKSFKSGCLLNIAMNVATNYTDYQLKDPNKIPAVLYFTMENSMCETFERIYNYLGLDFNFEYEIVTNKKGKKIKKYKITDEEVDEILDTIQKETYDQTGIALRIEFRTHMSVDTGELDKFYENYALIDNQEIIFVVQDYIKRIHSQRSYRSEQKRDELGEVVNEFCNFAKNKDIPVLTASQLNRDALRIVENAKTSKKKDIGRGIGASTIGESSLIYENADYTIITNREFDKDKECFYQTFKLIMARGKSELEYFAQPYDPDPCYKNFRIAVDIDLPKPLGIDRISNVDEDDVKMIENSPTRLKAKSLRQPISYNEAEESKDLDLGEDDEEDYDAEDQSKDLL